MYKKTMNSKFLNKLKHILIITSVISLVLLVDSNFLFNYQQNNHDYDDKSGEERFFKNNLKGANGDSIFFEGIEQSLIINDTGLLNDLNQEISVSNQGETNLTYYLDDVHDWKVSKIQTSINNIQDTREWVNNSDFFKLDNPYRVNQSFHNIDPPGSPSHNYSDSLDDDPTNPSNVHSTITESGANAMRLHFSRIEIETEWDVLFFYDNNNVLQFSFTGMATDFYTPWITTDTLKLTINSDSIIEWYGYEIDYYEFYNESTNYFDYFDSWGGNNGTLSNNFGPGEIDNSTATYVTLLSDPFRDPSDDTWGASYNEGDFTEIYQNITIPRGAVIDAYISFDYYAEYAMDSNENFIYCEINDKKVYSKGLGDILDAPKQTWYSTGKIYMGLWTNTSSIFDNIQNNNDFNISVGIMSGASVNYFGYDDRFQQIFWFDNISLGLTTLANSSQNDINLTINGENLFDDDLWGKSYLNLTGYWDSDPVVLSLNTNSPSLEFKMDTTLHGFHETTTKIEQSTQEGISYKILENGSIYWEFSHNFFMPADYSDFEFEILKPMNWEFISVLDPTLDSISFEGGNLGDMTLKINKTNAKFPGWWTFTATSPNYIEEPNTKMFKQGQWDQFSFITGETTKIRTQVNNSNEIPSNLVSTVANLTIYDPDGLIWYEESIIPLSNGTVLFSDITFTALNSVGGQYNYTIFWSNGTAVGGVKSDFIVNHQSLLTLLKPDDAKMDNTTGATVGDIIPVRIYLKDAENDLYISNALVSYNWTTGTQYFIEAALGIYETILDTSDLGVYGLYNIVIHSSKLGFINSNLTLMINLGENTNLQRLESDSKIVIHENSTIRFFYYSEFDDEGISGAEVFVNISTSDYYTIRDLSEGIYSIEFSTAFVNNTGVYRLIFEFTSIGYEPQIHIYQFEIVEPPVISESPNILLWVILFVSIGIGTVFAALSLRSYVLLPRKRKKEAELLSKTQRFKDLKNIQAIVIIHKMSGIPIYSKSYSILEKHKKELFSGFIQAITTVGEEFSEEDSNIQESKDSPSFYGTEKILELDFKYFYCLIADKEDVRAVFVLKEKSSERLKSQVSNLILALNLKISTELENWDGSLDIFEATVPTIINEYFELYYKGSFRLSAKIDLLKLRKEKTLSKLEIRVLNVIQSASKRNNNIVNLDNIIELVSEENKDLIIEALEALIARKMITPINP